MNQARAPHLAGGRDHASSSRRAGTYAFVVLLISVGVWWQLRGLWWWVPNHAVVLPWWVIAVIEFVTWRFQIRLRFQRVSFTLNGTHVPLVIGLFTTTPMALLTGSLAGALAAEVIRGSHIIWRLAFNVALFFVTTELAVAAFHAVTTQPDPHLWTSWLATAAALLAASVIDPLIIGMLWVFEGQLPPLRPHVASMLSRFSAGGMGLAAVELIFADPKGVILLLSPLPLLVIAARAAQREQEYRSAVSKMGAFEQSYAAAGDLSDSLRNVLRSAREMFGAANAEAILVGSRPDDVLYRARVDRDGIVEEVAGQAPWGSRAQPLVQTALESDAQAEHTIECPGDVRDVMVAPLRSVGRVIGALIISGRAHEIEPPFTDHDVELFDVFTQQVVRALERRELEKSINDLSVREAEMTYKGLHDQLTGLANRELFNDRLTHALARERRDGKSIGVMFLDLDNLKPVNDNIGHAAGDTLIRESAHRIKACVRETDTAARLGGDEFAVVLEGVTLQDIDIISSRIVDAISQPIHHESDVLNTTVSIGVSVNDGHMTSAQLIERADAAMYAAKKGGKGRYLLHGRDFGAPQAPGSGVSEVSA